MSYTEVPRPVLSVAGMTRRQLLGAAVAGAVGVSVGATVLGAGTSTAGMNPDELFDVVIVGGGLSGLAAARSVARAGKSVRVLEARERAGGRVHNITTPKLGVTLDAGAEFVGPTQTHIAALAHEYGVVSVPTYNEGDSVFWNSGRRSTMPSALGIPIDPASPEAAFALAQLEVQGLLQFPVGEPWKHPDASYLDSITWKQWLEARSMSPTARMLLSLACSAALSVEADEVSALYFFNYVAAAGDEANPGSLIRLLGTSGGAQERLFVGGAALIPLRMAAALGDRMLYNAAVRHISWGDGFATVQSDAGALRARKVIVAMSPAITGRIQFSPGLPAGRTGLQDGYRMGAISKFAAVYAEPFWRAKGLSGQVIGNGDPIDVCFENYAEGNHVLMGFISADAMRRLDNAPQEQLVDECIKNFVDYFGPEARDHLDHGVFKWDLEPWSQGGPVAVSRPGTLTRYGNALRAPVGPVHWAGTETSDYWTGYMDGAVRSGERAAREVIAAL
ncbi:FAD-dependent oxidoreductase [Williamsia sp. DF01-3]|uniref:flavin monoamine oxidase family protein n=1 Tax=Williamsia sp. DF01-3 TaxID=2934157 RepID=UPI001FF533CE|nr:FAD-dependent oxidoreductase [Williamsia sp. DF01-3]MCK0519015.1 FAD-dependent oxidoreductase [Williamsia sp. DF01-3]